MTYENLGIMPKANKPATTISAIWPLLIVVGLGFTITILLLLIIGV